MSANISNPMSPKEAYELHQLLFPPRKSSQTRCIGRKLKIPVAKRGISPVKGTPIGKNPQKSKERHKITGLQL